MSIQNPGGVVAGGPAATRRAGDLVALPKVHVHVHLDGSYPLAAVQALAESQGGRFEVPESFPDVWSFFDAYGTVPELVRTLDDLAGLCRAVVFAEAAEGVLYLEPAIEPQLFAPRLGTLDTVTQAIVDALQQAGSDAGIDVGANLTINTDQDLEIAAELARVAASLAGRGVTALGTAGFEEPAGLGRFVAAARIATDAGLQIVSHAGQTGGPDSILEALDVLGATRLSHGVNAVRSDELLARLAEQQIVCDVCPVSNIALGVSPNAHEHQARRLIAAGVPVTLNADDSLWFHRSVTDQYALARDSWQLDDAALANVASAGLLIPGMKPATRSTYRDSLAAWFTAAPG
jgi:adenosine deaminase